MPDPVPDRVQGLVVVGGGSSASAAGTTTVASTSAHTKNNGARADPAMRRRNPDKPCSSFFAPPEQMDCKSETAQTTRGPTLFLVTDRGEKLIADNRRARHDYHLLDRVEAGLVLTGTEVKSLRDGRASLQQAYADVRDGEAWLVGAHISVYDQGNLANHDPTATGSSCSTRRSSSPLRARSARRASPSSRRGSTSRTAAPKSSLPWPAARRGATSAATSPSAKPTVTCSGRSSPADSS